jgi:hypothetical protein
LPPFRRFRLIAAFFAFADYYFHFSSSLFIFRLRHAATPFAIAFLFAHFLFADACHFRWPLLLFFIATPLFHFIAAHLFSAAFAIIFHYFIIFDSLLMP